MKIKKIFFISKDANWQKYRLDILTKLGEQYNSQITVLTTGKLKEYIKPNKYVIYKSFRNLFPQRKKPSFFPGALFYIIKNKPDAVICLNNATQLTEYFALLLSKFLKIKFIWWTHGYDHDNLGRNKIIIIMKKWYSLFFLKLGDRIIVFSDSGKNYLKKFITDEKIIVAHNTLDTDALQKKYNFIKKKYRKREIRRELELNEKDFVLLFSGRLNVKKRVDDAIEVVKKLADAYNIKLIIIGDGEIRTNLEKKTEQYSNRNVFFKGAIFDDDFLAKYFYASDLFIMPGYVGLAIINAFSFGLPIITESDSTHGPEIEYLVDGENGFLVEEGNIEMLKNKIMFLMKNRKELRRMSINAIKVVNDKGNVNYMISQMGKAIFK